MSEIVEVHEPDYVVEVGDDQVNDVTVNAEGLQGPPGPAGPPGAAASRYTHSQNTPSTAWSVPHGLGFHPNVIVWVDDEDVTDGVKILRVDDNNLMVLTDSHPIAGKAVCN